MVDRRQRFTRGNPCPVCGGHEQLERGEGKRCTGYLSTDGKYVHCSREDKAGGLPLEEEAQTYAHLARGPCRCGVEHAPGDARPARAAGGSSRIVATYDYVNEAGDLLFQVVRKEPKAFLQRRPDPSSSLEAPRWIWGLGERGETRRVLYRLPELLAADASALVYVVEGEKDVDRLRALGVVATSNPHGAGKWAMVAKHASDVLTGRAVVVIADNDPPDDKGKSPGVDHAKVVSKSLRCPWLTLPDAKDVASWLERGNSVQDLDVMARDALAAYAAKRESPSEGARTLELVKGDWTRDLLHKQRDDGTDGSALRPVPANAITILANDSAWAGVLAYDEFAEAVVTLKVPPWRTQDAPRDPKPGEWTALDTTRLQSWLAATYALDLGHDPILAAVQVVADRARVHPVRDWLRSLKWDGKRRLPSWLVDAFGAEDDALTRAVGTAWIVSAVARIFDPGCQVDTVLVLEGAPGLKKSSVLRALIGDEWFFEMSVADVASKDAMQVLRCKWVGEFPEIDSLSRAEWGHVKAYFSRRVDRYRESYGRKAADFMRQVIFAATTNKGEWIGDETGGTGRRMWPIAITRGDEDSVRLVEAMREQLFAEAVARYESEEAWHFLDPELVDAEREAQDARYMVHPWEERIASWVTRPVDVGPARADQGVSTADVLAGALGMDPSKWTERDARTVGACLRHLGWVRDKNPSRRPGARVRLFRPAPSPDADPPADANVVPLTEPDRPSEPLPADIDADAPAEAP